LGNFTGDGDFEMVSGFVFVGSITVVIGREIDFLDVVFIKDEGG